MKNILLAALIAGTFISGCDIVEPPYKKENVVITSDRKVLLEDYTGHQCPNCPTAAGIIHDMQGVYGDNLVVIAVHAGPLAKLMIPPFLYDFTTETGDTWYDYFEMNAVPIGLVNRQERSGSRLIQINNWPTLVGELLSQAAEAEISMSSGYDPGSRQISIEVHTNIASPKPGEQYFITVLLTEDSIIKPQKNSDPQMGPTPVIMDYKHMHVLRHCITYHWGEKINPAIVDQKNFIYTIPVTSDIVPANCHVVAFISNANKEVLQAEEVRLHP